MKNFSILVLLLITTACLGAYIASSNSLVYGARVLNAPPAATPFMANQWQNVLLTAVDQEGNINFEKIKAQPKSLNAFLQQLKATSPDANPELFPTPQDKLAYWLNAYNALSLRLIVDRYPISSLAHIPHLMSDKRYAFGNVPMSLEMLQEKIVTDFALQPALMPKALFALSLHSQDSPPLSLQPYQGATLKQQLDSQVKRFISNPKNVRLNQAEYGLNPMNTCAILRLSPWFAQVKKGLEFTLNSRPDTQSKLGVAKVFFETVKPYLSTDDLALMMVRCPHGVGYLPPNPQLRERKSE